MYGSVFPEKFCFENYRVETTTVDEVIRLIYTLDAGFSGNKNGPSAKKATCPKWLPDLGYLAALDDPENILSEQETTPACGGLVLFSSSTRSNKLDSLRRKETHQQS